MAASGIDTDPAPISRIREPYRNAKNFVRKRNKRHSPVMVRA
jgi:hypothetical protein